ncbi:MAG: glycerol-3-phosphate 1-O-acyltransferase PlsY [Lachnospiraceae bacterium]|nr:glycerol-3-phosphate 1-O-acyltransferase PlsY [Lachnospiraceae bacterium]
MLARLISILIGYACGHFITGFFYGKTQHVDLREVGSGNVGTTNTYRNLGPKAGILTLLGDVFKVVLSVLIVWLIYHNSAGVNVKVLEYYAALGTILGHNFPIFMKFHGGKGIACTGGLMIAVCPICVPVCLTIFIVTVLTTKYVSLSSILVCISFFVQILIFGQNGMLGLTGADLIEVYILAGVVMVLGIARHHANIGRLIHGTESKFSFKAKKQES